MFVNAALVIDTIATGHYRVWFADQFGAPLVGAWVMTDEELQELGLTLYRDGQKKAARSVYRVLRQNRWIEDG